MRPRTAAILLIGASTAAMLAFLVASGVDLPQAARLVAVVCAQVVAGGYWWRLLRARHGTTSTSIGALEILGMAVAIGTATAMLCGVLAFAVPVGPTMRTWAWAVPTAAAAVTWAIRRYLGLPLPAAAGVTRPQLVALGTGGTLGLASLIVNLANYPLDWVGSWDRYHPDMLFFEALSTSMASYGPSDSIFMAGADLRYHWFTYAWAGDVTQAAGAGPFVVLTRVLPLVALLGALALAVGWSARLSKVPWVPTVAALLLVSGGYVGATYGTILNFDSPSQALSTVWLLALCVALLSYLRRRSRWPMLIAIAALVSAVAGGKISSAIVVAGGFGLVMIVGLARRESWRARAVQAAIVSGVVLMTTYLLVIAGSAESGGLRIGQLLDKASSVQGLNPTDSSAGIVAGTLILALAMIPRWAGLAWLAAAPTTRWRPPTLFGVGLAATALLTVGLVSGGLNDTWFALAASAPLSVLSAVGVGRAVQSVAPSARFWPRPIVVLAAITGLVLSMAVIALWTTGSGGASYRWLGPILGVVGALGAGVLLGRSGQLTGSRWGRSLAMAIVTLVAMAAPSRLLGVGSSEFGVMPETGLSTATFSPFLPFVESIDRGIVTSWSADQVDAADWLAATAPDDDIIATNVTYSPLVPALVGRRMLIADIMHQAPYGRSDLLPEILQREHASWEFIDSPSLQTVAPLCAAGVDWVWIDPARTGTDEWLPYASVAYEAADVIILRLDRSSC